MPQKKQRFRFRIPWIKSGESPKHRSKSPSKSDIDVPIQFQRSPFRPPGISIPNHMKVGKGNDKIKQHTTTASSSSSSGVQNKNDISKFVHEIATVNPTHPMNDKTVSVVTLAGENRGATMHASSTSAKKERSRSRSIPIHRAYRTNNPSSELEEENSCSNNSMEKALVNSNIQSMNNSIMLDGSITGRDPGVRVKVILPQHPPQEPIKPVDMDTRKAEVKIWRAEKLSYQQPVIRRRCLRGLFLEPSDSEPDNPHKPRRHGCKVRCGGEIRND